MRQALLFLSPSRDKQRHRASEARKSGARFEMQAIWAQNPLLFIDWLLLSLKRSWTTTGEEGRENPSTWLEQTAYSLGLLSNQKEESSAHLCVLSHVWLCNLKHCGPPGSSIHGMFQARIPKRVASLFSRRSSRPRDHILEARWKEIIRVNFKLFLRPTLNSQMNSVRWFAKPPTWQFKYNQSYKNVCSKPIIAFQALQFILHC